MACSSHSDDSALRRARLCRALPSDVVEANRLAIAAFSEGTPGMCALHPGACIDTGTFKWNKTHHTCALLLTGVVFLPACLPPPLSRLRCVSDQRGAGWRAPVVSLDQGACTGKTVTHMNHQHPPATTTTTARTHAHIHTTGASVLLEHGDRANFTILTAAPPCIQY